MVSGPVWPWRGDSPPARRVAQIGEGRGQRAAALSLAGSVCKARQTRGLDAFHVRGPCESDHLRDSGENSDQGPEVEKAQSKTRPQSTASSQGA